MTTTDCNFYYCYYNDLIKLFLVKPEDWLYVTQDDSPLDLRNV